jgi:hypothetical protein
MAIWQLGDTPRRALWFKLFFTDTIERYPALLLKTIEHLPDAEQRQSAYREIFSVWMDLDPQQLMEWQRRMRVSEDTDTAYALIAQTPDIDVSLALIWSGYIQKIELRNRLVKQIIQIHGVQHPATLIEWAMAHDEHRDYLPTIYKQIAAHAPAQALSLFDGLKDEPIALQKNVLARFSLAIPADRITPDFIDAIGLISDPELQKLLVNVTLTQLTQSGHIEHLDPLLSSLYSAQDYPLMQSRLAAKWATSDPLAAADYVQTIDDPKRRQTATASVIKAWAQKDLTAASEWLKQQNGWEDIELAAAKMAQVASYSADSIDVALEWLSYINDPNIKQETTERVARSWYTYNAEAATQYLEQSDNLTEQQKQKLMNYLTKVEGSLSE